MSSDGTIFRVILERYKFIGFAYSNAYTASVVLTVNMKLLP